MRATNTIHSVTAAGMAYAALLILCWSSYNVAAKAGVENGFSPSDVTAIRYIVAGALLGPVALIKYSSFLRSTGLMRILLLAALSGPLFGLIAVSGFVYAPLSHGMLFAPAAAMTSGTVLSVLFNGEILSSHRLGGIAIMLIGLAMLAGFEITTAGPSLLLGDLLFFTAGSMWGLFTFLLGRWQLDALATTCAVATLSGILSVLLYFLTWDGNAPEVSVKAITLQVFFQGIVGGGITVFALAKTTEHLGVSRTALLPILTPAVAMVMSIAFVGTQPSVGEILGAFVVSAGLLFAIRG